jgi:ABC-2 type transport system permease protein
LSDRPPYFAVFAQFARNSLVREMTFRWNFLLDCVSSLSWVLMQLGFYLIIFEHTRQLGQAGGWGKWEFFVFLSTTILVNSLIQAFFLPGAGEFSELIRTGNLDFALLKPIDTQFLVTLQKIEWSSLSNTLFGVVLLGVSLGKLDYTPTFAQLLLFVWFTGCGIALLYSLVISLGALSVWLGRNDSLYDFWFYITTFARYPLEIYEGRVGSPLRFAFTFIIPILVVVNVPARILARPLVDQDWGLAGFALAATAASLFLSRRLFVKALLSYRSASS